MKAKKIKIMNTPPLVTDDEIRSFMDFEALLKRRDDLVQGRRNLRKIRYGLAVLAGLLAVTTLIYFRNNKGSDDTSVVSVRKTDSVSVATPPSARKPSSADKGADQTIVELSREKNPASPPPKNAAPDPAATQRREEESQPSREADAPDAIYVQAEPVDGYPDLYSYFARNLVYPRGALKDSVEGIVNVVFVVEANGSASNITVENSLGPLFDEEVLRLLKNMPAWKPATYNGRPVRSKVSLPIAFDLEKVSTR